MTIVSNKGKPPLFDGETLIVFGGSRPKGLLRQLLLQKRRERGEVISKEEMLKILEEEAAEHLQPKKPGPKKPGP